MFKYFAKSSLIADKTHQYQRQRCSSTTADRNKAYYLEIKEGLLRYLVDFKASFLLCGEKNSMRQFRHFDPTANEQTRRCAQASR